MRFSSILSLPRSLSSWVALGAVLAVGSGCPEEQTPCTSTLECNVGEVCEEGVCEVARQEPEPEEPEGSEPSTAPPETEIVGDPAELTNENSFEVAFQCADDVACAFECSLDDGQFGFCTSPAVYSGLAEGDHRFRVRGIRANVFVDESPAEHNFTVDQTPPDTTIEEGPDAITTAATVAFTLGCIGAEECTYDCELNGEDVGCGPFPNLADGTYVFAAAARDPADNLDPSPVEQTFEVDRAAPETTLVSGPPATTGQDDATFIFECSESAPEGNGCTFECAVDEEAYGECESPFEVTDVEAAEHIFRVRAVDAAGNVDESPAEQTWTVDGSIPVTQIDLAPLAAIGQTTTTIEFSCNRPEGCTYTCAIDSAAPQACGSPLTLENLVDGVHTVVVTASNQAGTPDPNPPTVSFFVDTVVPEVALLTTPDAVNDATTATFEFTCSDPEPSGGGCTYECAVDGAEYEACASPKAYTGLADGNHTFEVRGSDLAGNLDVSPELFTWRVDTTAPQTVLDVAPDDPTSNVSATFEFSCEDPSQPCTFECSVDGAPLSDCTSPFSTDDLAEGDHTFSVVASDALEFTDLTAATHEWTVDLTAPETNLSGPDSPTQSTAAAFVFSCNDEPCTFVCSLDGATPSACTSGISFADLAEGVHTFEVVATDSGGTADPSPAVWAWEVDVTPPTVVFTSVPSDPSNDPTPTFEFECEGGEACTFECASTVGGTPDTPCNNGVFTTSVGEGADNVFEVVAYDVAGNSQRAFSTAWTTDFTAPDIGGLVLQGPTTRNNNVLVFTVFCQDATLTRIYTEFEGVLTFAGESDDDDGQSRFGLSLGPLPDGTRNYISTCLDEAGNESFESNKIPVTIDTVAPIFLDLEIEVQAGGPDSCKPVFTWEVSDDTDTTAQCGLDGTLVDGNCSSPFVYSGPIGAGDRTGTVFVTDEAGNSNQSTVSFFVPINCAN